MTHGPLSWRELVERDKQKSEDARGQIKRAAMQPTPRPQEAVMQSDIVQRLRRTGELGIFEAIDQGVYSSWEDAADEIERNRAEITRLTEALRAAEEREKALREALEPFAKCCEDWISDDEDDEEWAKFRLLIKDYRRASVAMKEQGHDG